MIIFSELDWRIRQKEKEQKSEHFTNKRDHLRKDITRFQQFVNNMVIKWAYIDFVRISYQSWHANCLLESSE